MSDLQLYIKLSSLPIKLKSEVADYIDFLKSKRLNSNKSKGKRVAGKAKGLLKIKENFDDPIEGFNEYIA
ncbi:MAG: DUF2281 domain-containing protein [Salinivirgaceae bacterium]|jgi:hypothetical protein|nr:DUF2281 domain-containing protein [Salinivirgaceae bacterium]